jgi:signal transduction histidine kinase
LTLLFLYYFLRRYVEANHKELSLNYYISKEVPRRLLGDEMRLRQIVTNLISNAVKFTDHGSVELRVRVLKTDQESASEVLHDPDVQRVSLDEQIYGGYMAAAKKVAKEADARVKAASVKSAGLAASPADRNQVTLLFEVLDTGMGISHEDQGKLFTAFQQVNSQRTRQQGGTGLGLSISMRLVRLMGGDIVVTSNGVGQGSRFAFTVNLSLERVLEAELPKLQVVPNP